MGFGILWFVIIMIIVVRFIDASKGSGGRPGATRPPQANRPGQFTGQQGKWTLPPATPGPAQQKSGSYSAQARPAQQKSGSYSAQARPAQQKSAPYNAQAAGGGYGRQAQQRSSAYGRSARPNDRRYAMPARPLQSAPDPVSKQKEAENTILQKARENASEHFGEDTLEARGASNLNRVPQGSEIMRDKALEGHIHSVHGRNHEAELRNRLGVDDYDTFHLIDEVNDLIVKGYSGNLEFERDFLAEGMDFLSRISM